MHWQARHIPHNTNMHIIILIRMLMIYDHAYDHAYDLWSCSYTYSITYDSGSVKKEFGIISVVDASCDGRSTVPLRFWHRRLFCMLYRLVTAKVSIRHAKRDVAVDKGRLRVSNWYLCSNQPVQHTKQSSVSESQRHRRATITWSINHRYDTKFFFYASRIISNTIRIRAWS
jgi:hypothetical protein